MVKAHETSRFYFLFWASLFSNSGGFVNFDLYRQSMTSGQQPLGFRLRTLPTAEILSGKNVRAWVSMVSYLRK